MREADNYFFFTNWNCIQYKFECISLKSFTKPKSNQSSSNGKQDQMDISTMFISNKKSFVSMETVKDAILTKRCFSR